MRVVAGSYQHFGDVSFTEVILKLIIDNIMLHFFVFLITFLASNCCFIIFSHVIYSFWHQFLWSFISQLLPLLFSCVLPFPLFFFLLPFELKPFLISPHFAFDVRYVGD